jgi:hypothetical protein
MRVAIDRKFEQTLAALINSGEPEIIQGGRKGVEKESLRVTPDGRIAQTPHPRALGSALTNEHITTDYSEALIELVSPTFRTSWELLQYLLDQLAGTVAGRGHQFQRQRFSLVVAANAARHDPHWREANAVLENAGGVARFAPWHPAANCANNAYYLVNNYNPGYQGDDQTYAERVSHASRHSQRSEPFCKSYAKRGAGKGARQYPNEGDSDLDR